jgi:hypothetical protein
MPWIRGGSVRKQFPAGFRLVFGGGLRGGDFGFGFGDDDIMLVGKQIGEAARSVISRAGESPFCYFIAGFGLKSPNVCVTST